MPSYTRQQCRGIRETLRPHLSICILSYLSFRRVEIELTTAGPAHGTEVVGKIGVFAARFSILF